MVVLSVTVITLLLLLLTLGACARVTVVVVCLLPHFTIISDMWDLILDEPELIAEEG